MECPRCGSKNVTYSHRRGIEKVLRFFYPSEPFRCKECWTRFWKAKNNIRTVLAAGAALIIAGAAIYYFAFPGGQKDEPQPLPRHEPKSVKKSVPQKQDSAPKESGIKEEDILPRDQTPPPPEKQEKMPPVEEKSSVPHKVPEKKEKTPTVPDSGGTIRKSVVQPPTVLPDTAKPLSEEPLPIKRGTKIPAVEISPPSSDAVSKPDAAGSEQSPLKVKLVYRAVKKVLSRDNDEEFKMILSTDGPIRKYSHFALNPPPKLVLDIPGKWRYPGDTVLPVESDIVESIRVGEHSDMLRVVIDLKGRKTMIPAIEETQDGLMLIIKK